MGKAGPRKTHGTAGEGASGAAALSRRGTPAIAVRYTILKRTVAVNASGRRWRSRGSKYPLSRNRRTIMSIQISNRAKSQLLELGAGGTRFLRIAVVSGGCSGNTYSAVIDDALDENDELVYQEGDLRAVADRQSARYLAGLEIDYSDDLVQSGFRFRNPLAVKSCGCGASFAALSLPGSA